MHDLWQGQIRTGAPALSPETARLVFAQRLGVSRYHSIKHVDEETVQHINKYGGPQQKLFREKHENPARVLIWIDDVEGDSLRDDITKSTVTHLPEFKISNPPASSDSERLIQDFILQAQSLPMKADPQNWAHTTGVEVEAELMKLKQTDSYNLNGYLNVFHADKNDKIPQADLAKSIANVLNGIVTWGNSRDYCVTVVLMPPSPAHSKRAAQPYGTYDLPSTLEARRDKTEMLLSPAASEPSAEPQNPNVSNLEDMPTIQISQANNSSPVLGILPSCFNSQGICEKKTHFCSGHGSCGVLHNGTGKGKDTRTRDCYACFCKADVVQVSKSSNKTTVWGGPACQKKDVSVPFWLFAGTGILLAFLISSGIGLLYSMGSEELPSVIGAGVSGPTRK
ncbi:hypothetical protein BDV96DRAFT_610977 [Lophiotrema nucula]|uniref:Uncharacterized protein n=1 Tax=Lophiotrema nucula TaxID=690887 RepID=A0A6A5ZGU0_9PLEO|nr:hypothetical protein BDV96DRAFT_610977 [Lophiotrema nucula]